MPSFPFFVLAFLPFICNASPINRQVGMSENVYMTTQNGTDGLEQRVCSIDAVTYRDGETIPTTSPCEHCVCRPPGFACTITSCEYRPGCKAFRRSDQCCPEYQCECEKDGKIYQNGEKIVDNNNPCEVCYCQGGEIICAVIDCYWRNDCQPRYIDNRCCPMYDHCPPPQAQGPIRHRIPQLTSPSPITWHNVSQTITTLRPVSTSEVFTETSTTTTEASTTTSTSTTTQAPSSSSPAIVNDEEVVAVTNAPSVVPSENVTTVSVPVEPVKANDASSDTSDFVADSLPIQTTTSTRPEVENSLNDDDKVTTLPLNDDLNESDNNATVTEQLPSSTSPSPVVSESIAVADSNIILHDEEVAVTSESRPVISQDDEAISSPTSVPIHDEASQGSDVNAVTQTIEQQFDATEKALPEGVAGNDILNNEQTLIEENAQTNAPEQPLQDTNGNPTESVSLVNDQPAVTENTVMNDDVSATSIPSVAPSQVENEYERNESNPDALVRNDLFEANIDSDLDIQNDEISIVTSLPPANLFSDKSVYSDATEVTTSRQILHDVLSDDQAESTSTSTVASNTINDEAVTANDSTQTVVPEILSDEPEVITQQPSLSNGNVLKEIQNDEPEAATQQPSLNINEASNEIQNDEPEVVTQQSSPSNNDASEEAHNDATVRPESTAHDDVTQQPSSQNDEAVPTEGVQSLNDDTTEGFQVSHDDAVTEAIPEIQHDYIQSDNVENHVADENPAATESSIRESYDDVTEGLVIANDDAATEQPNRYNDVTESFQAYQDAITERLPVSHADAIGMNDGHVASNDAATERVIADQAVTDRITEEPEDKSAPLKRIKEEHYVFDIILDDEVSPSQPETLNQIKETPVVANVESKPSSGLISKNEPNERPLANGQTVVDRDTIQILNLQEVTNEAVSTSSETTVLPQMYVRDEEVHDDEAQHDDANENQSATEVNNAELNDDPFESSTVLYDPVSETTTVAYDGIVGVGQAVLLNDETTQRQLRDELDEILRHHLGIPHDDEQNATTVSPQTGEIISADINNDDVAAVTDSPAFADELPTSSPENPSVYKNKVQKVAEALLQQNDVANSEESVSNKFRLELDVFAGSQENVDLKKRDQTEVDVSTALPLTIVNVQVLNDEPTTSRTFEILADDSSVVPTQQPERLRGSPEVSTERIIYDAGVVVDETTKNDLLQDDQAVTTPASNGTPESGIEILNDEVEGSGGSNLASHDDVDESGSADVAIHDDVEGSGSSDMASHDELEGSGSSDLANHDEVEGSGGSDLASRDEEATERNFAEGARLDLDLEVIGETTERNFATGARLDLEVIGETTERNFATGARLDLEVIGETTERNFATGARLDLEVIGETTVAPVLQENEVDVLSDASSNDAVTNTYSFRMDLLNSFEDNAGSSQGDVEQSVVVTNAPQVSIAFDGVTEPASIANDDQTSSPVSSNHVESVLQDAAATESISKFRADLEIGTEASANINDDQNDFVEVSTSAPSGFAVEYRENVSNDNIVTQAPVVSNNEKDINEEVAADQVVDIIPDDEPVTQGTIPILNLYTSDDVASQRIHISIHKPVSQPSPVVANDEVSTQAATSDNDFIVNDEPANQTPEGPTSDEPVTQADELLVNDQPGTQAPVAFLNDEAATQAPETLVNDEPATQAPEIRVNDERGTQTPQYFVNDEAATQAPEALVNDQPGTQAPGVLVNDEPATQAPEAFVIDEQVTQSNEAIANDEAVTQANEPLKNDEPATQTPVGPADDEPVTQINEIHADDEPVTEASNEIANDEPVTQSNEPLLNDEPVTQTNQALANDVPVTQANEDLLHDEPVTQTSEAIANDDLVTQATEVAANDQPGTQAPEDVANDEPVTPTSEAIENDEPVTQEAEMNANNDAVTQSGDTKQAALDDHEEAQNDESVTSSNDDVPVTSASANDEDEQLNDEPISTVPPLGKLRSGLDSIEQQTEAAIDDATALNDDISVTTASPVAAEPTVNNTITKSVQDELIAQIVQRAEIILPQTGMPKIQPISPDLSRYNRHELRFDFPVQPEKEASWLSRAVSRFRRLAGFDE